MIIFSASFLGGKITRCVHIKLGYIIAYLSISVLVYYARAS